MITQKQGLLDRCVTSLKTQVINQLAQNGPSLDIGCGDKRFTQFLPNAIGIDTNKEFEGTINSPDYFMDARDIHFPNETFFTVALLDTLEHIPETNIVIGEVWRVLKPDGIVVIIDPNDSVLFWARLLCGRIKQAFNGNPDHIHRFDKDKLVELV